MLTEPPAVAGLRIGDAERDAAITRLGDHLRAGRLDPAEYSERAESVWTARTAAELAPLFGDLPGGVPSLAPPPPRRGPAGPRSVTPAVLVLLLVAAVVLWVAFVRVPPFFLFPIVFFALSRRRWHAHRRF